jgi:hypothetical protein
MYDGFRVSRCSWAYTVALRVPVVKEVLSRYCKSAMRPKHRTPRLRGSIRAREMNTLFKIVNYMF